MKRIACKTVLFVGLALAVWGAWENLIKRRKEKCRAETRW